MYKLSLSHWTLNLSQGLFKDFVYANLILMPVVVVSFLINCSASIGLSNTFNILYRLYFTSVFVLSCVGLYILKLMNRQQISLGELKSFKLNYFIDYTNIYFLGFVFFTLIMLFFSLKMYKKFLRKRFYEFSFFRLIALVLLVGINIFCAIDIIWPIFNINYKLKNEVLAKVEQIQNRAQVDIHKSFEEYLGLNTEYENKESLLNLLKRKTNQKKEEFNVVFLYLNELSKADYKKHFSSNLKSYSFNRTLMNSDDQGLAVLSLKSNIPAFKSILLNLKDREIKDIKTYYLNPFKAYNKIELEKVTLKKVNSSIAKMNDKFFIFSSVSSFSDSSIKVLFEHIKKSNNTIFVITGGHKTKGHSDKTSLKFLKESTFLTFYLPKALEPKHYDKNRVVGQEDLMTTLYNLALSNKDYLSLGDDIFLESNSNAINLELYADQQGAYIDDVFYSWRTSSQSKEEDRKFLKQRYEATKDISRYIIFNEFSL